MIKIDKKIFKKMQWYSCILAMFLSVRLIAEPKNVIFTQRDKDSINNFYLSQDMYEEDKILQEIYITGGSLYKKLIEVVALYYCANIIVDADIMYEKIGVDVSKDLLRIIVLLGRYIPALCKNKKIKLFLKIKKLTAATSFLMATIMIVKKLQNQKILLSKKQKNILDK